MATWRNRIQFGEEALFVSPSAIGFHYTGAYGAGLHTPPANMDGFKLYSNAPYPTTSSTPAPPQEGWECGETWPPLNPSGIDPNYATNQGSIVKQLKRIQSISYGFNSNLTDVNQFGNANRIASVQVEAPVVNLEFSYYLLDGFNERHIGFPIDGATSLMEVDAVHYDGRNYFIETVPEGHDATAPIGTVPDESKTVIAIGNGFITNYNVKMSVSEIPTASVSVEAYNVKADIGTTGLNIPAINPKNGALASDAWLDEEKGVCNPDGCTGLFSLPNVSESYGGCGDVSVLRPGDIVLDLKNAALFSKQVSSQVGGGAGGFSCETLGVPWPEILAVTSDTSKTPATINVDYSFILAGTSADGGKTCVTLKDQGAGPATHANFITDISAALAQWKSVFEYLYPWLTLNFTNLGDESAGAISVASDPSEPNYALPQNNIGDFRFGMHPIDGGGNVLGHGYSPGGALGSVGNVGGDTHFDSAEEWRLDSQSPATYPDALSIEYVAAHEVGHNLGFGHSTDPNSLMYFSASKSWQFSTRFPQGLSASASDLQCIQNVYGGGAPLEDSNDGTAHIQSATIDFPLTRSEVSRLGNTYGFTRSLDVPITVTLTIQAIVAELKKGNLVDLLCACQTHDLSIKLYDPACASCPGSSRTVAMEFSLNGATLDVEKFTTTIGDNQTVDLTFTAQL